MPKKSNQKSQKKGHRKVRNLSKVEAEKSTGNNVVQAPNPLSASRSPNFFRFLQFYHRRETIVSVGLVLEEGDYTIMAPFKFSTDLLLEAVMKSESSQVLDDFRSALASPADFAEYAKNNSVNEVADALQISAREAKGIVFEEDKSTGIWFICDEEFEKTGEGSRNLEELLRTQWYVRAPELKPRAIANNLKELSNKEFEVIRPLGSFGSAQLSYVQFAKDEAGSSINDKTELGIRKKVYLRASSADHIKLMDEALIQQFVAGPRIVKIIGSSYVNGTSIFTEQCSTSLHCFLQANRGKLGQAVKLRWSIEAAEALVHIQYMYLHRNVRSTSFFLTSDLTLKLGNFECAETHLFQKEYNYDQTLTRFLPPETLFHKRYDPSSESWGYGVLVWEIYSEGKEPHAGLTDMQVRLHWIKQQRTPHSNKAFGLKMPWKCPLDVIGMIETCWVFCLCCRSRPSIAIILNEMKEGYNR